MLVLAGLAVGYEDKTTRSIISTLAGIPTKTMSSSFKISYVEQ
jgi:hypothetical protein